MTSTPFNFNVGILGHVDSGKTSLSRRLSEIGSTAAFDAHPQSKQRGITLDLGFSSFQLSSRVQVTLVDCPGHASLLRTVIGGAQIIDLVLLIVDSTKGMQTQTAECLLLAEIVRPGRMIVVFNKTDLVVDVAVLDKLDRRFRKTLATTSFRDVPFIRISATHDVHFQTLIAAITDCIYQPDRSGDGQFLMAIDHCFSVRGQGTVVTGTVLSGRVKVGQTIELPVSGETCKVRSMQMFYRSVTSAEQGDRVALCLPRLDSDHLERGLACGPGTIRPIYGAIVSFTRIVHFLKPISSRTLFHVSIGHDTLMASCSFFKSSNWKFSFDDEFEYLDKIPVDSPVFPLFCLLTFTRPFLCPPLVLYIASRLDTDIHSNSCRLAFHGRMLHPFFDEHFNTNLSFLKIFKRKRRSGNVDRFLDEKTVVVQSLFKKETDLEQFTNLKVSLSTGEMGRIEGGFGQGGKIRVVFSESLASTTLKRLTKFGGGRKKRDSTVITERTDPIEVFLDFRRFIYDPIKRMVQR